MNAMGFIQRSCSVLFEKRLGTGLVLVPADIATFSIDVFQLPEDIADPSHVLCRHVLDGVIETQRPKLFRGAS